MLLNFMGRQSGSKLGRSRRQAELSSKENAFVQSSIFTSAMTPIMEMVSLIMTAENQRWMESGPMPQGL